MSESLPIPGRLIQITRRCFAQLSADVCSSSALVSFWVSEKRDRVECDPILMNSHQRELQWKILGSICGIFVVWFVLFYLSKVLWAYWNVYIEQKAELGKIDSKSEERVQELARLVKELKQNEREKVSSKRSTKLSAASSFALPKPTQSPLKLSVEKAQEQETSTTASAARQQSAYSLPKPLPSSRPTQAPSHTAKMSDAWTTVRNSQDEAYFASLQNDMQKLQKKEDEEVSKTILESLIPDPPSGDEKSIKICLKFPPSYNMGESNNKITREFSKASNSTHDVLVYAKWLLYDKLSPTALQAVSLHRVYPKEAVPSDIPLNDLKHDNVVFLVVVEE